MIDFYDDILKKYATEDQLREREELTARREAFHNKVEELEPDEAKRWGLLKGNKELSSELDQIAEEEERLSIRIEKQYIDKRGREGILTDCKVTIDSITKEDFLSFLEENKWVISVGEKEGLLDYVKDSRKRTEESFINCYEFILTEIEFPIICIFDKDEDAQNKIYAMAKARASLWYVEPESSYLPVLQGRATNLHALVVRSSVNEDRITKALTYKVKGEASPLTATVKSFEGYRAKLRISTDKLLQRAIAEFTKNNHIGEGPSRCLETTEVIIDIKDYARANNKIVDKSDTSDKEEAKKEANRIKKTLSTFRKNIEEDLEALATTPLTWTEKAVITEDGKRGYKDHDFIDVMPLSAKGLIQDQTKIYIKFNEDFASYLIHLPINQYPTALLGLDERKPNAYSIGKKIASHFFMDNNQLYNRAQYLKVKTLLKETDLPSLEEVRAHKWSWISRIKEPFENCLDALGVGEYTDEKDNIKKGCGLLEDWEYCHSKGVPLTDKEATALLSDFTLWTETLIKFTLYDIPDQTERLEKKRDKIEKAKEKKSAKKKNQSKDQT